MRVFLALLKNNCCFDEISSRTNIASSLSTFHLIFDSMVFFIVFKKHFVLLKLSLHSICVVLVVFT
jgi:hypothetical protein